MSKKPHEASRIASFIERRVLELKPKKSQLQIANEAGFPNPNMITMLKQGANKLALDRVPAMARARVRPGLPHAPRHGAGLRRDRLQGAGRDLRHAGLGQRARLGRGGPGGLGPRGSAPDEPVAQRAPRHLREVTAMRGTPSSDPSALTENERAWLDFLRLIADGRDPAPTLRAVQILRRLVLHRRG